METFILVIHVLVCLFLIFIVLVQGGKGAEMGAAFGGGSSQTLFGGRGAATFLGKLTTVMAIFFMLTSLTLAMLAGKVGEATGIDLDTPEQQAPLSTDLPTGTVTKEGAPVAPPASGDAPAAPVQPSAPVAPAAPVAPPAQGK